MELTKLKIFLSLPILLLCLPNRVVGEPKVPCFFVFGDSLVDNGNNVVRETTAKVDYYPYGIDYPTGPTGRFSNGRNVADLIANLLGFDKCISPYANGNGANDDILRGLNYGSGGAGILEDTGRPVFGNIISLNEQLSNHDVTVSRLAGLLGSKAKAKEHLRKCIYSVGLGNNDYLAYYLPQYFTATAPYNPQQFAALLVFHYSIQLRRLYGTGARKIAVSALGGLGCLPQVIATYGSSAAPACVETVSEIAGIFNGFLQILLKELNAALPEAKFLVTGDIANATSFGNIKFVSDPCCEVSNDFASGTPAGHCLPGKAPCGNRDEYLFWDGYHPTEAANMISARVAYEKLSPLYEADADYDRIAIL